MKVVVALFQHETNAFSSLKTPLQAFATPAGFSEVSMILSETG